MVNQHKKKQHNEPMRSAREMAQSGGKRMRPRGAFSFCILLVDKIAQAFLNQSEHSEAKLQMPFYLLVSDGFSSRIMGFGDEF